MPIGTLGLGDGFQDTELLAEKRRLFDFVAEVGIPAPCLLIDATII
jgi:hypothetical protein